MNLEDKCETCVFHIDDYCEMPKILYGEELHVQTSCGSSCEMFTKGIYEGVHIVAFAPSVTLAELMMAKGMHVINLPRKQSDDLIDDDIAGVLNGSVKVDERIAKKLESLFGVSVGFWLNLQKSFDWGLKKVKEENENRRNPEMH